MYTLVFSSGDRRRVLCRECEAVDIDGAAGIGIAMVDGGEFGTGASWFLSGVIQSDTLTEVSAAIEAL